VLNTLSTTVPGAQSPSSGVSWPVSWPASADPLTSGAGEGEGRRNARGRADAEVAAAFLEAAAGSRR